MAFTYRKIASVTVVNSTVSTIEFTSINQNYTDLVVLVSARSNRATNEDGLGLRINSTTSGYTYRNITADGSSVASATTNFEQTWSSRIPAANATGSTFSSNIVHIPNYAGSTAKSYMVDGVTESNASLAYMVMEAISNTSTSPITSITFNSLNASLVQHSTATLYGILQA
jgi:hypothetical protein